MKRVAACLALLAVWGAARSASPGAIEEGRPFPPVELPSAATGELTSIEEFHGRRSIVHVFASW